MGKNGQIWPKMAIFGSKMANFDKIQQTFARFNCIFMNIVAYYYLKFYREKLVICWEKIVNFHTKITNFGPKMVNLTKYHKILHVLKINFIDISTHHYLLRDN